METLLTLSTQEISTINKHHIYGTDKWFRMFMGIASELVSVQYGYVTLNIIYSKQATKKSKIVAKTWVSSSKNYILTKADFVVVREYSADGSPGSFFVEGKMNPEMEAKQKKLMQEQSKNFGCNKIFMGSKTYEMNELQS